MLAADIVACGIPLWYDAVIVGICLSHSAERTEGGERKGEIQCQEDRVCLSLLEAEKKKKRAANGTYFTTDKLIL